MRMRSCDVAAHLVHADAALPHVAAFHCEVEGAQDRGRRNQSSTLPGAGGQALAYPARLEVALQKRLPDVAVKVISAGQAAPDRGRHG